MTENIVGILKKIRLMEVIPHLKISAIYESISRFNEGLGVS